VASVGNGFLLLADQITTSWAPQGFLEPFHFHFEYAVSPEPGTLGLIAMGMMLMGRRMTRRPDGDR